MDGATALALPTKLGQRMVIKNTRGSDLIWKSYDKKGDNWFSADFGIMDFSSNKTTDPAISKMLNKIFRGAINLNSEFLSKWNGFKVETFLEFPRDWGLGSSSTLVHLVAEWAEVHPLQLYYKVFDGSGYDVACAGADGPISFISNDEQTSYTPVEWNPSFTDQLFFVHLNEKADSQVAVKDYFKQVKSRNKLAKEIDKISQDVITVSSFSNFQELLEKHEAILSKALVRPTVKEQRFSDYSGCIKSLGAWGGDFVLACGKQEQVQNYFTEKGYATIVSYDEMILAQ